MALVIARARNLPDLATEAGRVMFVSACALALILGGKVLPF